MTPTLLVRSHLMNPVQHLGNLLWAYAICGVYHVELFDALAAQAEVCIRSKSGQARDLSSIAWAMSKTRHYHAGLLHLMSHRPELWHHWEQTHYNAQVRGFFKPCSIMCIHNSVRQQQHNPLQRSGETGERESRMQKGPHCARPRSLG